MELNKHQTPIEDLQLENYPEEIQEQFFDFLHSVPFIHSLISKDRKRACDLPRDNEGKIIVDVTNPHILEDMDYFRPTALFYQKNGKLTHLRPNPNPNSEYGKWFKEEIRRCLEGYVRPSDGEWVTGDMYFFLNYCPIMVTKISSGKKALRVWDFPEIWEGHYYKFHYIHQARQEGHHGAELSRRGSGKSYSMASIIAKRFILGETKETTREVKCLVTAYQKEYLTKDGILNKFQSYTDFCAQNTQFPNKKLKQSLQDMAWTMGYIDLDTNTRKGSLNEVLGISSKDDESKLRGKRGVFIGIEEFGSFPNLLGLYGTLRPSMEEGDYVYGEIYAQGCVCAGTKVYTNTGKLINIEDVNREDILLGYNGMGISQEHVSYIQKEAYKPCVEITTKNGFKLRCSTDHPLLTYTGKPRKEAAFSLAGDLKKGDRLAIISSVPIFGDIHEPDAYLLGLLFGDGSYSIPNNNVTLSVCNNDEYNWLDKRYTFGISKLRNSSMGIYAQLYFTTLHPLLIKYGMDGQANESKELPNNIDNWDKESICNFLGGYFEADGNVQIVKGKHRAIKLTCKYHKTLKQIQELLIKLGIRTRILKEHKKCRILHSVVNSRDYVINEGDVYVLYIDNGSDVITFRDNIKFISSDKQKRLDSYNLQPDNRKHNDIPFIYNPNNGKGKFFIDKKIGNFYTVAIKGVEDIGIQRIYNLTADTTHTYITNGFISANTAGDSDSDFASAQELMYNPLGYNMKAVKNVYDKEGQGRPNFVYFFPGYLNRKGCYDENGNSDVTKAILEILINRYNTKYNSSDINAITKVISEIPITPQEAILRSRGNMFPITAINERINQLDNNPSEFDDVYTGELVFNTKGEISYKPTSDLPIRDFPLKDNKAKGTIEIFKMPEVDKNTNKVYANRYIIGHDPVDNDSSNTLSLTSTFVLDLWTDKIVAEYTGRQDFADDNFEIVRKLCLFYNAKCMYEQNKKGLYSYFSKMNSVYLLAETPEHLRDKDNPRASIGNNSRGINATLSINNHANELIRDWLLKPVPTTAKQDGEEIETTIPNLYFIKSRALLKELSLFNPEINVDRIRALGMVMLYREELMAIYQGDIGPDRANKANINYLGNDPFFSRNYDLKFNIGSKI